MLDGQQPQLVSLEQLDGTPVAHTRHECPGQLSQRRFIVEGRRKQRAGLAKELELLLTAPLPRHVVPDGYRRLGAAVGAVDGAGCELRPPVASGRAVADVYEPRARALARECLPIWTSVVRQGPIVGVEQREP